MFVAGSGGSYEWLCKVLNSLDAASFAHALVVCRGWYGEARNTSRWIFTHLVNDEALEGHDDAICALYSLPGNLMVSGSEDNSIRVWNAAKDGGVAVCRDEGGEPVELTGHDDLIIDFASCQKSGTLLSISFDSTVRIWDTSTWQCISTLRVAPRYSHCHAITVVDGILCVGADGPVVTLWDLDTLQKVGDLEGHQENVQCSSSVRAMCSHPNEKSMFTGGDDCRIIVWQFVEAEPDAAEYYKVADDDEFEEAGPRAREVTCLMIRALEGHTHYVRSLACSQHLLAYAPWHISQAFCWRRDTCHDR